jgi:hypothetical protein
LYTTDPWIKLKSISTFARLDVALKMGVKTLSSALILEEELVAHNRYLNRIEDKY